MKKPRADVTPLDQPTAYMVMLCQRALASDDTEAQEHAASVLSASVVTLRHEVTRYPDSMQESVQYLREKFGSD